MRIWIDFSNSPHVLFFAPLVQELEKREHRLFLTHREFAQTSRLLEIKNIKSTVIGKHGGKGALKKILNIAERSLALRKYAINKRIDLAISHNSYAHCLAAKSLFINYLTIMDYEYQPANHINFRLADTVLTPFTFRLKDITKYGVKAATLVKYPGLKEEVYLWDLNIKKKFWETEYPQLDPSKVMCTIRPPATMAAYHNFKNPIFDELLNRLLSNPNVQIVFFARTKNQEFEYRKKISKLIHFRKGR
jgi:predicted glycosyltransferase